MAGPAKVRGRSMAAHCAPHLMVATCSDWNMYCAKAKTRLAGPRAASWDVPANWVGGKGR